MNFILHLNTQMAQHTLTTAQLLNKNHRKKEKIEEKNKEENSKYINGENIDLLSI